MSAVHTHKYCIHKVAALFFPTYISILIVQGNFRGTAADHCTAGARPIRGFQAVSKTGRGTKRKRQG